ncbi:MAG: hypothetical protein HY062_10760, partial [Bacteroidetes bacterium]|nr:hypothetical protein [Bacteroidota bacterium]
MKHLFFFILIIYGFGIKLNAQKGNNYIKNFSPSDYKASDQNWGGIQDKNGILYFANLDGVLIFDGKHWKIIQIKNNASVFSIDIDSHDKIFVGGDNQFGYLKTLQNGEIIYQSLSDSL